MAQVWLSAGKVFCSEQGFCLLSDQIMLLAVIRKPSGDESNFPACPRRLYCSQECQVLLHSAMQDSPGFSFTVKRIGL